MPDPLAEQPRQPQQPAVPSIVVQGESSTPTQPPPPTTSTPFTLRQPPPGRPVSFVAKSLVGDASASTSVQPPQQGKPADTDVPGTDVDMPGPSTTTTTTSHVNATEQRNGDLIEDMRVNADRERDKERGLFMLMGDSAPSLAQVRKGAVQRKAGKAGNCKEERSTWRWWTKIKWKKEETGTDEVRTQVKAWMKNGQRSDSDRGYLIDSAPLKTCEGGVAEGKKGKRGKGFACEQGEQVSNATSFSTGEARSSLMPQALLSTKKQKSKRPNTRYVVFRRP
ncbi:hypothetical protein QFC22_001217 [Naganishia vaughanmartiniae]|uniref:Uncharacterized protein n=1 Tax=Naganishia vaughanmartiniae TaxID=1424756 RepID=A0ACC2XGR7_9TREE|nr:hypothetical protein QFC22_001217 [Naganishia vaughanmartiniae]